MIVPMKKVSLLVMDKDRDSELEQIRDLGVLHVEKKSVSSSGLSQLMTRLARIEQASGILDAYTPKKTAKFKVLERFEGELAVRVLFLTERKKKLEDYMFSHQREKTRFEKWGDFNPADFKYCKEYGLNLCLYEFPLETYGEIVGDVPVVVLSTDKKNNMIRLLAHHPIPGKAPYPIPDRSLSAINERDRIRKEEYNRIEDELMSLSLIKNELVVDRKTVLAEIEFETASAGMGLIEDSCKNKDAPNLSVSWITGYVPVPDMGALKRAASENSWALYSEDPAEEDEVPTKLENNKATQLIYPLTGFLELIPGYRETDISSWFLIFFTLFFGMIFGDAAYGVILFLIALLGMAKTAKKGVPLGFKFLFLMSVSNIIWGVLVCSWFALDTAVLPRILQDISLPFVVKTSAEPGWLAAYNANNFWIRSGLIGPQATLNGMDELVKRSMLLFCFSIALVQLSIAHIKNCLANIRSLRAIGEIGRLAMILGMYFLILSLIVFDKGFSMGYDMGFGVITAWPYYVLIGGFVLMFVFGSYEGNLKKAVLSSCSNIITVILSITNVFSDIMSYIRLWAVGLAATSIAGMINSLAVPIIFKNVALLSVGVVFFAFGHLFNMVLNVLAVLVHGVRLNMLEFSSHVGVAWSGFAYKPFAKR